jgi:nicotinic acid phosphoribosyltransferase
VIGNWHKLGHNMFPSSLFSGLLTDLYELTMAAGYIQNQFDARATFELFVRHLPRTRNYLVAAGLEQAPTEYCVRCTTNGLLRRGYRVSIVTETVRAIDKEKAQQTLETLHSLGARLITTTGSLALVGGRLSVFRARSPS